MSEFKHVYRLDYAKAAPYWLCRDDEKVEISKEEYNYIYLTDGEHWRFCKCAEEIWQKHKDEPKKKNEPDILEELIEKVDEPEISSWPFGDTVSSDCVVFERFAYTYILVSHIPTGHEKVRYYIVRTGECPKLIVRISKEEYDFLWKLYKNQYLETFLAEAKLVFEGVLCGKSQN